MWFFKLFFFSYFNCNSRDIYLLSLLLLFSPSMSLFWTLFLLTIFCLCFFFPPFSLSLSHFLFSSLSFKYVCLSLSLHHLSFTASLSLSLLLFLSSFLSLIPLSLSPLQYILFFYYLFTYHPTLYFGKQISVLVFLFLQVYRQMIALRLENKTGGCG